MDIQRSKLYQVIIDTLNLPTGLIACYELSDFESLFGAIRTEQGFLTKLLARAGSAAKATKYDQQQLYTLTALVYVRAAGMGMSEVQAHRLYDSYMERTKVSVHA